jgi:Prohead core protein serine protease
MLARNLIVETPNYEYDILHEKSNREGEERYYIQGPYMQYGVKNKNNRSYQESEMIADVQRYKTEMIDKGRAGGELNHSPDPEIKLDRMCHKIVNLERDGNLFIGKSMVLSTPQGKILESLIKDKVNFGMSTKSLGQIQESKDGVDVVSDFMLIGVDAVYDPSCTEAFVNGILENKQFIINTSGKYEQTYERFERGLSKYPSSHSEHINNHIKEQIQMFLESLKK